jgi:hypothetical protein
MSSSAIDARKRRDPPPPESGEAEQERKRMQELGARYASLRENDARLVSSAIPTRNLTRLSLADEEEEAASEDGSGARLRASEPVSPRSAPSSFLAQKREQPPALISPESREALLEIGAMPLHRPMFHMAHLKEIALRATEVAASAPSPAAANGPASMDVSQRADVMRRPAKSGGGGGAASVSAAGGLSREDPAYPTIDRWNVESAYVAKMYERRFAYHVVAAAINPEQCQFPTPLPVGPDYADQLLTEPYAPRQACSNGVYCVGTELRHPSGAFAFGQYVPQPDWEVMQRTGRLPTTACGECYACLIYHYNRQADWNLYRKPQGTSSAAAATTPAEGDAMDVDNGAGDEKQKDLSEAIENMKSLLRRVPIVFYHVKNEPGGYADIAMREVVEGHDDGLAHPFRRFDLSDLMPCEREVVVRVADSSGRVQDEKRFVRAFRERDELRFRDKSTFEKADSQLVAPAASVVSEMLEHNPPRVERVLHAALVPGSPAPGRVDVSSSPAKRAAPPAPDAERERAVDETLLAMYQADRDARALALQRRLESILESKDPKLPPLARSVALDMIRRELDALAAEVGAGGGEGDGGGRSREKGEPPPPPPLPAPAAQPSSFLACPGPYVARLPLIPAADEVDPLSALAGALAPNATLEELRRRDLLLRPLESAERLLRSWAVRLFGGDWSRLEQQLALRQDEYAPTSPVPLPARGLKRLGPDSVLVHVAYAQASLAERLLRGLRAGQLARNGFPPEEPQRTPSEHTKKERRSRQAAANQGLVKQLDYFVRHHQPLLRWLSERDEGDEGVADASLLAVARPEDGARVLDLLMSGRHLETVPLFQEDYARARYETRLVWREGPAASILREASKEDDSWIYCDFRRTLERLEALAAAGRAPAISTARWSPGYAEFELQACRDAVNDAQQQQQQEDAPPKPGPMLAFVREMAVQARGEARQKRLAQVRKKVDVASKRLAESMRQAFDEEALLLQQDADGMIRRSRSRLDHMQLKNERLRELFRDGAPGWWREGGLVEGRGHLIVAALAWRVNSALVRLEREAGALGDLDARLAALRRSDSPGAASDMRRLAAEVRLQEERVQDLKRFVNSHLLLAQGVLDAPAGRETDSDLMRPSSPQSSLSAFVRLYPYDVAARNDDGSAQLIVKKISLGALYYGLVPSPLGTAPRVHDVRLFFPDPDADERLASQADFLAATGDEGTGDWREMLCKAFPKASSEHAFSRKNDAYCVTNPLYYRFDNDSLRSSLLGLYRHCRVLPDFATAVSLDRMFQVTSAGYAQRRPLRTSAERCAQQALRSMMMRNKKLTLMAIRECICRQVEQTPGFEWADTFTVMDAARATLYETRSLSRANETAVRERRACIARALRERRSSPASGAVLPLEEDEDEEREDSDSDWRDSDDEDEADEQEEEQESEEPADGKTKKKKPAKKKKKKLAKKKKRKKPRTAEDEEAERVVSASSGALSGTYRVTHNDLPEYMCRTFRSIDSQRLINSALRAGEESGDPNLDDVANARPRRIYRLSRDLVEYVLYLVQSVPPGSPVRYEWLRDIGVSEHGVARTRLAYHLWRDRAFESQVEACLCQLDRMDYELLSVFFFLLRDHYGAEASGFFLNGSEIVVHASTIPRPLRRGFFV